MLGEDLVQLGPELTVSTPFSRDVLAKTSDTTITVASQTSAELLLGAKLRLFKSLVIGAGAGPGLTQGWGTPVFFAVGSVAYAPLPPRPGKADTDSDGILDVVDACVKTPGVASEDPKKNGCPPDGDGDGIIDQWWTFNNPTNPKCAVVASDHNADGKPDPDSVVDLCGEAYTAPKLAAPVVSGSAANATPAPPGSSAAPATSAAPPSPAPAAASAPPPAAAAPAASSPAPKK